MPGPAPIEQIFGQALTALQQGSLDLAERHFKSFLTKQPHHLGALNLLGIVLLRGGKSDEAERCLRKALRLGSQSDPATLSNHAMALRQLGRRADAIARLDEALALDSNAADVWNSRGLVLDELGRSDAAVASFEKAIAIRPDLVSAHYHLANSLSSLKHFERALGACDRALALDPDFALAWFGRSQTLKVLGQHREALDAFEKYLLLETPRDLPQWRNIVELGKSLFELDLIPAIYSDDGAVDAQRARLDSLLGEIERQAKVLDGLPEVPGAILNAVFSVAGFNIAYQQKDDRTLNQRYANVLQQILRIRNPPQTPRVGRPPKIRFGVASALLKDHNGTRWALDWLAHLPRSDYSFFVYAFNADLDEASKKFAGFGDFRQLVFNERTLQQTIAVMHNDRLDVLMLPDVGMTPASRILAQFRIAPMQFSAWGHPVTTGSSAIDYYLSSDLMEPPDGESHYTERLVRLPNLALYIRPSSYAVDDRLPFDLPPDRLLFGCLQSLYKYLPRFDSVFPRIAARLPTACFLFIESSPSSLTEAFRNRLRRVFEHEGLAFERFVYFLPRMSPGQFGGLLKRIDVNIDSIGWSGGNTTIQSLERDCPLVTLPGEFMRGRHSYAMLKMIGVEELIAGNLDEFVDIAARLGSDRSFRASIVQKISQSKHKLYEDQAFIAALDRFIKSEHAAVQAR